MKKKHKPQTNILYLVGSLRYEGMEKQVVDLIGLVINGNVFGASFTQCHKDEIIIAIGVTTGGEKMGALCHGWEQGASYFLARIINLSCKIDQLTWLLQ